jgi:hypothetical protein
MKGSNMKKLITFAIVSSMLISTPVLARNYDRTEHREHKQKRKSGCGWLCGAIIGGVVVGALSSSNRYQETNQEPRDDNRYYPPNYRYDRRYCVREQITEWRYGERYVYWQTTCN